MTSQQYRDILSYLRTLIAGTQWEGRVFAVGGCCRDDLLGLPIKDVDLAVEYPDGGISFGDWLYEKALTTAEPVRFPNFSTSMLRLAKFPDDEIEIVQTRAEQYDDSTVGDPTVVFGSKEEDCRRRDLTINALYHDISADRLIDILGCSVDDINAHIIRTPADPDVTFSDDPVRILRAIRLSARYGWPVSEDTLRGMQRNFPRLRLTRPHRLMAEIEKILLSQRPSQALQLMKETGALQYIFPELTPLCTLSQGPPYNCTPWEHSLQVVDAAAPDITLRLAALFHDVGKPKAMRRSRDGRQLFTGHERMGRGLINGSLRRLHCDRDIIDRVIFLVSGRMIAARMCADDRPLTDEDIRRLQYRCQSPERLARLLALVQADNSTFADSGHRRRVDERADTIRTMSAQLLERNLAMFRFRHQLPDAKVRKLKGLPRDADMTPYHQFLLSLALSDPARPVDEVRQKLKKFNPPVRTHSDNADNSGNSGRQRANASATTAKKKSRHRNANRRKSRNSN